MDAIAEYVADTFDNQARILFETPDFLGPEEAGAVLDRCQQELVDLVKALVEQVATAGGAPSLAAALAGASALTSSLPQKYAARRAYPQ